MMTETHYTGCLKPKLKDYDEDECWSRALSDYLAVNPGSDGREVQLGEAGLDHEGNFVFQMADCKGEPAGYHYRFRKTVSGEMEMERISDDAFQAALSISKRTRRAAKLSPPPRRPQIQRREGHR